MGIAFISIVMHAATQVAVACGFHPGSPLSSVTQDLLDASDAILVGYDEAGDRYSIISRLKGPESSLFLKPIDALTKRLLRGQQSIDPSLQNTILFVRSEGDDSWRRLAYIERDERWIVDAILENAAVWEADRSGNLRFQFFQALLTSRDPAIQSWALFELDNTPYSLIRTVSQTPSVRSLIRDIDAPLDMHFSGIRIMLLGLTKDAVARDHIARRIQSQDGFAYDPLQGAWMTALIEIEGEDAIEVLGSMLSTDLTPEFAKALFAALALHSSQGCEEMRIEVREFALSVMFNHLQYMHVGLQSFANMNDFSLLPGLRTYEEPSHFAFSYAISRYEQQSRDYRWESIFTLDSQTNFPKETVP